MLTSLLAAGVMSRPLLNGADLSFLPEYRDLGAQFIDRGVPTDPLDSFNARGAKLVRLRVWVHPPKGYCSVERSSPSPKKLRPRA